MRWVPLVALFLVSFATQGDESKALDVFKEFIRNSRIGDWEKASVCIQPKSLLKIKKGILRSLELLKSEDPDEKGKYFGFSSREELEKADPQLVYVRYQKAWKDGFPHRWLMSRYVEDTVGTISKNGRVYILALAKYSFQGSASREEPLLYVAYKDGEQWKLADQGEWNIGD